MFKKLIELIKEAIRKMTSYKDVADGLQVDAYSLSDAVADAMEKWKQMYKDESPWLNDKQGIYSMGLAQTICNEFSTLILDEVKSYIGEPGVEEDSEVENSQEPKNTRASFLNELYQKGIIDKLPDQLEKGLAMGGFIIKPYMTANQEVAFDFVRQGDFYPLAFDDDGNITDIAFVEQFIEGKKLYTKVERQTFSTGQESNSVTVENKAFVAELNKEDDNVKQNLGNEIPLSNIARWSGISEEPVTINNVEQGLFGYYKVPVANTIDLDCPLGVSIFHNAIKLIERADRQFSRLDWEYEGGQIAIDVDPTALQYTEGYYGTRFEVDNGRDRVYRKLDLGADDTYYAFAPALRDNNYLSGLSKYLMLIEDKVGLARGTLSEVQAEARTATEIRTLRQKTFTTVQKNQLALEKAISDAIYAANVYVELYNLAPAGEYVINTEWSDSVLSDTDTELAQRMSLAEAGILSKAEVRAWYTGEDIKTAEAHISEMEQASQDKMLTDIYSQIEKPTLEGDDSVNEEEE